MTICDIFVLFLVEFKQPLKSFDILALYKFDYYYLLLLLAGLTLKKSKCTFATAEIIYLGHVIGVDFVQPRAAKVAALINFPRPTNRKQ